jgi:hypothetical protein
VDSTDGIKEVVLSDSEKRNAFSRKRISHMWACPVLAVVNEQFASV